MVVMRDTEIYLIRTSADRVASQKRLRFWLVTVMMRKNAKEKFA